MSKLLGKSTIKLVHHILTVSKTARDNDRFIQCTIWNKECDRLGIDSRKETWNAYYTGKLTSPETIRRVRQKLQEMHPELRGQKYDERQTKLAERMKRELKDLKINGVS